MGETHLVVDGSNIATEGRSMPSLQQLLDAVDAVSKEFGHDHVTVIVDATFGHRIAADERPAYEERVDSGQIITPPAGVIGRGDAFILEVADRADAVVLSNDSFQEFHGTYDWLFEEGRLLGGKHVPGVGWIFLARSPVRGPTSRRAVSDAKRKRRSSKKAATTSGKQAASGKKRAGKKKSSPRKKAAEQRSEGRAKTAPRDQGGDKRGGKEPEPYNEPLPFIEFVSAHPVGSTVDAEVEQFSSHGAYAVVEGTRCYISLKHLADPAPRSARDVLTLGETRQFVVQAIDTPRRGIDLAVPGLESIDPDDRPGRSDRPAPTEDLDLDLDDVDESELSVSARRKLRARRAARGDDVQPNEETPVKKAAKKKSATKKKAAAKKAASKKKAPARKSATKKKAATKKGATKKKAAPRKTTKKKAATKKGATKKKAASKKTASKKRAGKKKATKKKAAAKKAR